MQCCAGKPTWGCIPQLFAAFEPWRRHLRKVASAKGSQQSEYYMLAFDWREQTDKLGSIFFLRTWLVQSYSYGARLFGNTFLNFVSNFSLEGGNWVICLWQQFLKWGILNVPFCSIFVPFYFYLIMTLVVLCLDNIYLWFKFADLCTCKNWCNKTYCFGF